MKIGFLAELRNPPRRRRPWPRYYGRTLELLEEADRLGASAVFVGEHHLTEDGYVPQPLTFCAAVAARTRRLRIGTALVVAPFRHPLHIAEEAALVDILSDGRFELGLGAGNRPDEFEAFGIDRDARFALLDEATLEVRRLLDHVVTPRPVQERMPIWLGYFNQGARRAGRMGEGLLSIRREVLDVYLEGFVEGGHDPRRARMSGPVNVFVTRDPDRTLTRLQSAIDDQTGGHARFAGFEVLTPDAAVEHLCALTAGLPVEYVLPWLWIAGADDDLVEEHVHLMTTEVAPRVATP